MKAAILYNLRSSFNWRTGDPLDSDADWDESSTIEEILFGLKQNGVVCRDIGNPANYFPSGWQKDEFVISLCEMARSPFRESVVPALCEFFELKYFFSGPDTLHIALDKNLANLIADQAGIPVPNWRVFSRTEDIPERMDLGFFPCIIKPAAEGSGMGITDSSVFLSVAGLRDAIARTLEAYSGKVVVQALVSGREFTVGVVEINGVPQALCPIEIRPRTKAEAQVFLYNTEKKGSPDQCEYLPLASSSLRNELQDLAVSAHLAFGCKDVSRSDFRLDCRGSPDVFGN